MTTLIILFVFVALATVTEARNVENDCDSWKNIDWRWKREYFQRRKWLENARESENTIAMRDLKMLMVLSVSWRINCKFFPIIRFLYHH